MSALQPAATPLAPHDAVRSGTARSWADFESVYREHFRFVWRTVRRLGIEGALVDDVVQEVFLVVHRRLGDFEERSSAKTWLYGIARRVISDQRRTLRRKPAGAAVIDGDAEMATCADQGPEACAEQAERVRLLHRLLAELDDDKREAFVLSELEGLTMAEISEALDVNPNTISSRLRAARRQFEAALDRETQTDEALERSIEERRSR